MAEILRSRITIQHAIDSLRLSHTAAFDAARIVRATRILAADDTRMGGATTARVTLARLRVAHWLLRYITRVSHEAVRLRRAWRQTGLAGSAVRGGVGPTVDAARPAGIHDVHTEKVDRAVAGDSSVAEPARPAGVARSLGVPGTRTPSDRANRNPPEPTGDSTGAQRRAPADSHLGRPRSAAPPPGSERIKNEAVLGPPSEGARELFGDASADSKRPRAHRTLRNVRVLDLDRRIRATRPTVASPPRGETAALGPTTYGDSAAGPPAPFAVPVAEARPSANARSSAGAPPSVAAARSATSAEPGETRALSKRSTLSAAATFSPNRVASKAPRGAAGESHIQDVSADAPTGAGHRAPLGEQPSAPDGGHLPSDAPSPGGLRGAEAARAAETPAVTRRTMPAAARSASTGATPGAKSGATARSYAAPVLQRTHASAAPNAPTAVPRIRATATATNASTDAALGAAPLASADGAFADAATSQQAPSHAISPTPGRAAHRGAAQQAPERPVFAQPAPAQPAPAQPAAVATIPAALAAAVAEKAADLEAQRRGTARASTTGDFDAVGPAALPPHSDATRPIVGAPRPRETGGLAPGIDGSEMSTSAQGTLGTDHETAMQPERVGLESDFLSDDELSERLADILLREARLHGVRLGPEL